MGRGGKGCGGGLLKTAAAGPVMAVAAGRIMPGAAGRIMPGAFRQWKGLYRRNQFRIREYRQGG